MTPTTKNATETDLMCDLGNAEGTGISETKSILRLMDTALLFGFGILIPNMPFSVQYQVLKMLNKKELDIVFVSKSMSMGVNYPAKTCIIRAPSLQQINICEIIQMKGRAGRVGLITDPVAYSVTWNILHPDRTSVAYMPHIEYPEDVRSTEEFREFNIRKTIKLVRLMLTSDNIAALKTASTRRNCHIKTITSRSLEAALDDDGPGNGDTDSEDYEIDTGDTEQSSKKKAVSSTEDSSSYLELVYVTINECIDIISEFDQKLTDDVKKRVTASYQDPVLMRDTLYTDSYKWAEKINEVKSLLHKLHIFLHTRNCGDLLNYIGYLYNLIHNISLKYIGYALMR